MKPTFIVLIDKADFMGLDTSKGGKSNRTTTTTTTTTDGMRISITGSDVMAYTEQASRLMKSKKY